MYVCRTTELGTIRVTTTLQPNVLDIFRIEPCLTRRAFPTPVPNVLVDALPTEHVTATKKDAFLVSMTADGTRQSAFEDRNLFAQLLRSESFGRRPR